jgi:RNA polymerase sigma factor (sigma-70 family)
MSKSSNLHNREVVNSVFSQYIQDRSQSNFKLLYKLTKPYIHSTVKSMVKDATQTEDIVSECYILMLKKIETYDGDNFMGWFYKLSKNLTYDFLLNKIGFSKVDDLYRKRYKVSVNTNCNNKGYSDGDENEKFEVIISKNVESIYDDMIHESPNDCFELDIDDIKNFIVSEYLESLSEFDRRLIIEKYINERKYDEILQDEFFSDCKGETIRTKMFAIKKKAKVFYTDYYSVLVD